MRAFLLILVGWFVFLSPAAATDRNAAVFIDIFKKIDISIPGGWDSQPMPGLLQTWLPWLRGRMPERHELQELRWLRTDAGLLVVLASEQGDATEARQQVAVYRLSPATPPQPLLTRKSEHLRLLPLSGMDPFALGASTLFLYSGFAASEASSEGVEIWRLGEAATDPLPQDIGIPHAYGVLPGDGRLAVLANNFAWKNYFLQCGSCGARLPVFAVSEGSAFTLACTAFKSRYDGLARAALAEAEAAQRRQGDPLSIWDRRLLAVLAWLQAGEPDKAWPVFQTLLQDVAIAQDMQPWPARLNKDIAPLFTLPPLHAACPLQGRPRPPAYAEEG